MNGCDEFNEQFRETEYEKRERWAATRRKRTAEGKCWQCAKLIADCTCPNVTHAALAKPSPGESK